MFGGALFGLSSSPCLAGSFVAFGPETFERGTGQPVPVTRTFAVLDPAAAYLLRVRNGVGGFERVSSATIVMNGVEVLSPNDLNQTVALVEKPVTLQATNEMVVELRSSPGSALTVEVVGTDDDPPGVVATLSPSPNTQGWNRTDVTVSFACSDGTSGVATCPPPVVVTTEGANQLVSGTATDRAGNSASTSVTVSLDKTRPLVTIVSPADGTVRRVPRVDVAGTVADANNIVTLAVNGTSVGTGESFSFEVALQRGGQAVTVTAEDIAGNVGSAAVSVIFSPVPAVRITSPQNLAAFGTSPISVSGTVDDPDVTVRVGVEQIPATVSGDAFTATGVHLQEGGNVITAVATNAFGNSGTDSVTLILDTVAPRVIIDFPPDGFVVTEAAVSVGGRVNDVVIGTVNSGQARVTVNGQPAPVSNRTFLAQGVPLALGANTITTTAVDAVGNSETKTITVIREAAVGPRMGVVSGDGQSAAIGEALPSLLVVSVRDGGGNPLPGRTVVFRVAQNNGTFLDAQGQTVRGVVLTTDDQGLAAGRFVLGTRAGEGNNRVEVTSPGIEGAAVFTASGRSRGPAKINVDSGNGQKGIVGQPLPRPFVAVVTDEGHNRLADLPVTFSVFQGDGHFNGQSSLTTNTDPDGRAVAVLSLGPRPGIENNVVLASVAGAESIPAGFVATAFEPGDPAQTRISGVVLDNSNQPVPGVTLRIRGTSLAATANEQGQFLLERVPVGNVHLLADGSTAGRPGTWPNLEFEFVTVAGANNTLGMPVYLLPLDTGQGLFVDETRGGTLTLPEVPGFSLTVAPNSAVFPDGTRRGTITVTPVHADKVPMVPNFGQQPRFIVTIQPPGVRFDPPAAITHPNVDGLAPGEITELYSFDHDMGSFVATGTATVSADGAVLRSDPGTGIVKGGWHCGGNPASSGGSGSVSVTLQPKPLKIQYGKTASVTANGSPPKDGRYQGWTVKNRTFDIDVHFTGSPACADQPSCANTLKAEELSLPASGSRKACGTADAEVTFLCTTTGKSAKDTARIEVGCGGKGAADCLSVCGSQPAQGMCGTPCDLSGQSHPAFDATTGLCWKATVGGVDYCYWDHNAAGGTGFINLCCANRCFGGSFTVWGQGAGDYACTVIERCDSNPELARAFGGGGCVNVN